MILKSGSGVNACSLLMSTTPELPASVVIAVSPFLVAIRLDCTANGGVYKKHQLPLALARGLRLEEIPALAEALG
jgi:hypothetical protein